MSLLFKRLITLVLTIPIVSSAFALNLDEQVKLYEKEGWKIGLSILFSDNKSISINGNKRFPLDSTVKSLACANILNKVDAKKISLNHYMISSDKNMVEYHRVTQDYYN